MKRLLIVCALLLAIACSHAQTARVTPVSLESTGQAQGKPDIKVWVNTGSGVYHCPGTRWYGNTKKGEYMTQKQAQDKHYRPAYGKACE